MRLLNGLPIVYAFGLYHVAGVCDPTINHTSLYHKFQTDKIMTPLAHPEGDVRYVAGEATVDDSNLQTVHRGHCAWLARRAGGFVAKPIGTKYTRCGIMRTD